MQFVNDPAYIPSFWKDQTSAANHDLHTIDCANMDMNNPETLELLAGRMQEIFAKVGLVHLVHTGLDNMEDMRKLAGAIVSNPMVGLPRISFSSVFTHSRASYYSPIFKLALS
jgi:hypothetical protein